MAYNGLTAWIKFQEEQKRQRAEYEAAGMSQEAIDEICKYDEMAFKKDDAFLRHRADLPVMDETKDFASADDGCKWIYKNINTLSARDSYSEASRLGWLNDIEDEALNEALSHLTAEDLELLTTWVFDKESIADIARQYGQKQRQLYYKIAKIKKILKKSVKTPSPNTLQ